jgi:hypothetical protein
MDLFLRKVIHPYADSNYRVVVRDGDEIEIGSIGVQFDGWTWGIDTVVPMREVEAEGTGKDRADCMRQFRAAWDRFSSDPARLTEFLEVKRKRFDELVSPNARKVEMIKLNMNLPPEVARRFVEDMEAFHAEPNPLKREGIALRQLQILREYRSPRDGKLRLPDVKELFKLMHDYIAERKQ